MKLVVYAFMLHIAVAPFVPDEKISEDDIIDSYNSYRYNTYHNLDISPTQPPGPAEPTRPAAPTRPATTPTPNWDIPHIQPSSVSDYLSYPTQPPGPAEPTRPATSPTPSYPSSPQSPPEVGTHSLINMYGEDSPVCTQSCGLECKTRSIVHSGHLFVPPASSTSCQCKRYSSQHHKTIDCPSEAWNVTNFKALMLVPEYEGEPDYSLHQEDVCVYNPLIDGDRDIYTISKKDWGPLNKLEEEEEDITAVEQYGFTEKRKRSVVPLGYGQPPTLPHAYIPDEVKIPTHLSHYTGCDEPSDGCDSNKVRLYGDCHEILSQGPCAFDELVLVDETSLKGYCAPRLCSPDRVFWSHTKSCHDPREPGLCPPGRILYTSEFGTPICGCPSGTYPKNNDLHNDVCEPLLTEVDICRDGEVFWFESFRLPPVCLPDPCNGLNLNRTDQELPYVPSFKDGKCYQIGTQPNICSPDHYYYADLEKLKGVCASPEDAGYITYDKDDFCKITAKYGKPIPKPGKTYVDCPDTKGPITPGGTILIPHPGSRPLVPILVDGSMMPPLSPVYPLFPIYHQPKAINLLMPPAHPSELITVKGSITPISYSSTSTRSSQRYRRSFRRNFRRNTATSMEVPFKPIRSGANRNPNWKGQNVDGFTHSISKRGAVFPAVPAVPPTHSNIICHQPPYCQRRQPHFFV